MALRHNLDINKRGILLQNPVPKFLSAKQKEIDKKRHLYVTFQYQRESQVRKGVSIRARHKKQKEVTKENPNQRSLYYLDFSFP